MLASKKFSSNEMSPILRQRTKCTIKMVSKSVSPLKGTMLNNKKNFDKQMCFTMLGRELGN